MTRLAGRYGATNLAQGFPDFPAPEALKRAATEAIDADINQYSITWGSKPFRDAVAGKYARHYAMDFDPEREITVCCGATEGMIAAMLAVIDPGDEVVVFEPFYENYNPDGPQLTGGYGLLLSLSALRIGASTATNCGVPSTTAPKPSSSIPPTILLARFSTGKSSNSLPAYARNSTPWPLPMRSTSTSCMMAPFTLPLFRCQACVNARFWSTA